MNGFSKSSPQICYRTKLIISDLARPKGKKWAQDNSDLNSAPDVYKF